MPESVVSSNQAPQAEEAEQEVAQDDKEYGCIFCITGQEFAVAQRLEKAIPGLKAISPVKLRYRRIDGVAHEEKVILFPGYVFFEVQAVSDVEIRIIYNDQDVLKVIWNEICTALIYANRRAAKECELIPEVLGKEDSLDEHHELSMILDRLEANASEAMAKGIRAIRLSAEGYSHAEIGSILGESDKCVAARISRTRKYLRSHPDLVAF